jgi:LPXTG-motif cell wall-anchored protein
MRSTRLAIAGLVAGLVTLFSAGSAFAYGDEPIITIPGGSAAAGVQVAPGGQFSFSGTFGGAEVESYSASLLGQNVGSGANTTTWNVSGTAPNENGTFEIVMTITTADDIAPSASGLKSGFVPVQQTYTKTIKLVVGTGVADAGTGTGAGSGDNASGALPDTGGSNVLLLAGGAALVLAGAGAIAARRRHS